MAHSPDALAQVPGGTRDDWPDAVGYPHCLVDYLACLRVGARAGIMGGNPRNETQRKEK